MLKILRGFGLCLGMLGCFSTAWAEFVVPPLTGPIVDQVGMLKASEVSQISQWLEAANRRGKVQMQILVVPSLGGLGIEQASLKAVEAWKLGGAKTDNGVLLLVATSEKRTRLEIGQGLEGLLPDAVSKRILADRMRPLMQQGKSAQAVASVVSSVLEIVDPEFFESQEAKKAGVSAVASSVGGKAIVEMLLVFLAMMGFLIRGVGLRGLGRRRGIGPYWGGGFGGGGFGGGGGSWSGGGGGFSGGGASDGW